jgi:hypothetical protein
MVAARTFHIVLTSSWSLVEPDAGAAGMEAAVQTLTGALKAIATEATSASPKK